MSLICGALTWLRDHEADQKHQLDKQLRQLDLKVKPNNFLAIFHRQEERNSVFLPLKLIRGSSFSGNRPNSTQTHFSVSYFAFGESHEQNKAEKEPKQAEPKKEEPAWFSAAKQEAVDSRERNRLKGELKKIQVRRSVTKQSIHILITLTYQRVAVGSGNWKWNWEWPMK